LNHGTRVSIADRGRFGLVDVSSRSGLQAQFLPTGVLFALHQRQTLINQLLPGPAEEGSFRLLARWVAEPTGQGNAVAPARGWLPIVGPGLAFGRAGERAVSWTASRAGMLEITTTFSLHSRRSLWAWRVHVRNVSATMLRVDLLHAQDLGLADEAAVRNNEAYVSQYLDLLPVAHSTLGWVVLARQNQATSRGRHPWLAVACATGAAAFCTDGSQFFGVDHRLTGEPAAVRLSSLPSRRLQYEFALAGLQSPTIELAPNAMAETPFVAWYLDDHPAASTPEDAERLADMLGSRWGRTRGAHRALSRPASVLSGSGWLHGATPTTTDWDAWFPGDRRHEERGPDGAVLAFFHGEATHVVARAKEASAQRPHGHILRSGEPRWIDGDHLGVTCYAAGIFGAQAYLGNPNLARLLSVVRNPLSVARASGQRVFVRERGEWRQLGVPSAFAMTPGDARWIYRLADGLVEGRVWCSARHPAAFLELRVVAGDVRDFLVTHQLALGANELDHGGDLQIHGDGGWIGCAPDPDSFTAQRLPGLCFAIAAAEPASVAALGGDELLYADGVRRDGPYAVIQTTPGSRCGVILLGSLDGAAALPAAVEAAREEWRGAQSVASALPAPVRVTGTEDPAVARLDEILPWFAHNAGIHFSAPHGLEQYGGAAWGVRDVCQGSVEWLLAAGETATVRRLLVTVFARQYVDDGAWPQWFMHAPFHAIQQRQSHGDVPLWPLKALCDYVEATNDIAFLSEEVGYTDPERGEPAGPREPLWIHCDRVVAHCQARFAAGTALIDYGDGDWDDTLQPADPTMRTRLVSAWTVALAYQALGQYAGLCRRAGESARAARLDAVLTRMHDDFHRYLMPEGIVAGFLAREAGGWRPLLHPTDTVTGIRYRLLPMTRAVLAGLFTPEEARRHLDIVARALRFPDGVRLMSEPVQYRGGREHLFKRAESAANVGREIGLQYVHAHLRYAEAMAKVGDADALWWALQVCNPVGLAHVVPHAAPRQSNVYFSSSDADFSDRLEAAARWSELSTGRVAVRGGWRLYSSGPGLFLRTVRTCLLGVRESLGDIVFDPMVPPSLDGFVAHVRVAGRPVEVRYRVREAASSRPGLAVNGIEPSHVTREPGPYRSGGWRVRESEVVRLFREDGNLIEIVR
jgi:CRISPR-associated protein Csx3